MPGRKLSPQQRTILTAALFAACSLTMQAQTVRGGSGITFPPPPVAAVHTVTDDYHGTKIDDAYRWLEDAQSPETGAWIDEENKYTQTFLSQVKIRPEIVKGLAALERVDVYSMPVLRGGKYFFEKRLA